MTEYQLPPILDDWIWEIKCSYPNYSLGTVVSIFHFNSQKNDFVGTVPNDCIYCTEHSIIGDKEIIEQGRLEFFNGEDVKLFFTDGRFVFNDSL